LGAAALVTLVVAAVLQVGRSGATDARVDASCGTSVLGVNVGQVTTLVHGTVMANSSFVGGAGFALRQRHFLCTDLTGQFKFKLTRFKTTTCTTYPRSKLQLYPDGLPSRIILFLPSLGKSWCSTSKGKEAWFGTNAGQLVRLWTSDPVFGVTVTKRAALIQQTYGFFAVYPPRLKEPLLLGPQQQVSISSTGIVTGPGALTLTADDRAAIAELGTAVPRPDYSRPAAGTSKVLARMYASGTIKVGLDSKKATPEMAAFTKRYFTALARRWKLRLVIVSTDAPSALAEGLVDVIVAPTRTPGSVKVETVPFTQQGRTNWDLELLSESELVAGFRRYVRTSLDAADYAAHYSAAFSAAPSYERFRSFIFPSLPPTP
jgi:hypothetical protein